MPEYVFDEAFEHRLERVLREIGNEAVRPFDPYETTQMIITNSRIGGVPITAVSAAQMAQQRPPPALPVAPMPAPAPVIPPPGAPPGYYDEPLPEESRRWPLLAALALLIAALAFTGFATGFITLPSGFGITYESPSPSPIPGQTIAPTTALPTLTAAPTETPSPTPKRTRKPRRTPRPTRTTAPAVTDQPQPTPAPTESPTEPPTAEPPEPTPEQVPTQDAASSPI